MSRLVRCVPCVALVLALVCATFSVQAAPGPLSSISGDGLLGLVGAVLFSLLAGYAKGQERRITAVEFEQRQLQSQINLMRDGIHRDHPSRTEFSDLREDMRNGFAELKQMLREDRR